MKIYASALLLLLQGAQQMTRSCDAFSGDKKEGCYLGMQIEMHERLYPSKHSPSQEAPQSQIMCAMGADGSCTPFDQLHDYHPLPAGEEKGGTLAGKDGPQFTGWEMSQQGDNSATIRVDDSRVVALSPSEYTHLQALRQAVADEEERIAKAHGVRYNTGPLFCASSPCFGNLTREQAVDQYEYRGRFLLINVPEAK